MKHNFNATYTQPTPKTYVEKIVRDLDYQLPFIVMEKLEPFYQQLTSNKPTTITILGSAYGLEAIPLKTTFSPPELIAHWLDNITVQQAFPPTPQYQIQFVDIESAPLIYAQSVNLCDRYMVADMTQPYTAELASFIRSSEVLTGIGVSYYIGAAGFERLLKTAFIEGKARFLGYSVATYQDSHYIEAIGRDTGLSVKTIGENLPHRRYANTEEHERIKAQLQATKHFTPLNETHITANLYLISR